MIIKGIFFYFDKIKIIATHKIFNYNNMQLTFYDSQNFYLKF
jgi:hypothetical protein